MKKNTLGKILIAALAALVLCIGLMACNNSSSGDSGEGGGNSASSDSSSSSEGEDPMMDGEDAGKWNYNAQYVMTGVYGDDPQTNVAIQLLCENGEFTCDNPDKGIEPFEDEWGKLMSEDLGDLKGTYTWEYDGDVAKVTLNWNGQTQTVEIEDDGFERSFEIPATFFDPEDSTVYVDEVNGKEIKHSEQTLKFMQY